MPLTLAVDLNALPIPPPIRDGTLEISAFEVALDRWKEGSRHLEQLGDNVLGLCCGRYLRARYPTLTIGDIQSFKNVMVSNAKFAVFARHYGWDKRLTQGGRPCTARNDKDAANALEALAGALVVQGDRSGNPRDHLITVRFCAGIMNHRVFSDLDQQILARYVNNQYPASLRIPPVSIVVDEFEGSLARILLACAAVFADSDSAPEPHPSPGILPSVGPLSAALTPASAPSPPTPTIRPESSGSSTVSQATSHEGRRLTDLGAIFAVPLSETALLALEILEVEVVEAMMCLDEDVEGD